MSLRLENKIALITGGGRGIGAAIAKRFAEEGAQVYITDVNFSDAEQVAEDIVAAGGKATARVQDVVDEARWGSLIDEIAEAHGQLDVLVNNAGIMLTANVENATLDEWRKTQAVNLESVFLGARAALKIMKQNGGSMINLSSVEGLVGHPNAAAYNASKGGVRLFTKSVALHCAAEGYNIRVNSVHPGMIRTPMVEDGIAAFGGDIAATEALVVADIPFKALGEPIDIANGCLFLASDESKYMTGSELVIDGGYTCK